MSNDFAWNCCTKSLFWLKIIYKIHTYTQTPIHLHAWKVYKLSCNYHNYVLNAAICKTVLKLAINKILCEMEEFDKSSFPLPNPLKVLSFDKFFSVCVCVCVEECAVEGGSTLITVEHCWAIKLTNCVEKPRQRLQSDSGGETFWS